MYARDSVTGRAVQQLLAMAFAADSALLDGQRLLAGWDYKADPENRAAALVVLTTKPLVMANMFGAPRPDLRASYEAAVALLMQHFGRLDPKWSEVNRLVRGTESWPLAGAPDVLRAVYGTFDETAGHLEATAGDSYIMFVDWMPDGTVSTHSIHNFGSATLDQYSPHFDDQAPLFAAQKERRLPLDMASLEAEKTSDRQIGKSP